MPWANRARSDYDTILKINLSLYSMVNEYEMLHMCK